MSLPALTHDKAVETRKKVTVNSHVFSKNKSLL